jgi:hypothetical protein
MDGASATLTKVAALLGACQIQVLAQEVEQGRARIEENFMRCAIDAQGDRHMRPKFHLPT